MLPSGTRLRAPARGTLDDTPLAHVLVYIRNKRLSGLLELEASGGREARFDFWRGEVVTAQTRPVVARFGSVVYEGNLIDAATLDDASETSRRERAPIADILLAAGAITRRQRDEVLAEQLRRRVHFAFTFPGSARFTFTEHTSSTAEPVLKIDVLAPIWRGIVDFPPETQIAQVLGRLDHVPLAMVSDPGLERAELGEPDRELCEALALSPMTLSELRVRFLARGARVDQVVYLLVIAKCAARAEEKRKERATLPEHDPSEAPTKRHSFRLSSLEMPAVVVESGAPASSERPAMIVGPAELGAEGIQIRASALAFESAYEALGLREGASPDAARAAYMRLSRLWHPNQLPPHLAEVKGDATRILHHIAQAYRAIAKSSFVARSAS